MMTLVPLQVALVWSSLPHQGALVHVSLGMCVLSRNEG